MITIQSKHIPPGVNNLFANIPGKGRVASKRYKEWQAAAGWDFVRKGSIKGPYTFAMVIDRSKRRKGSDLDGRAKAPMDLLVKHQIVEDDSLCEMITIRYGDADGGFRIEVQEWSQ